ncbi:hypothetical protein [Micromonospora sp. RP3T]|uniref:hypothetical protein n=1 Tax=Micromonospora sp. RP3T TaxID=2135446 RepID=UPI003D763556
MTEPDAPTLPTLAELPAAPACPGCGCCRVDLCAAAVTDGAACVLLAAPPVDPATTARVLRCPCAPVTCRCAPPLHVRGIARCQHRRTVPASVHP